MRQQPNAFLIFFGCLVSMVAHGQLPPEGPAWMKEAVIYGIKPSTFVQNGTYDDITRKIPDLKRLGINTIWLQPVYRSARGGQGYDVTDFFSLRGDLGDSASLQTLVSTAKRMQIRVIFDFVPNHTSLDHPFAKDVIDKGEKSAYYTFYQHKQDSAAYHRFYHTDPHGFVYYFWNNLVNLDYSNPDVQHMIISACKYWLKTYDLDGFRFDAMWAVNARAPEFGKLLRAELRAVKPDILLLAEDKGCSNDVYSKGFDAAYDWAADTSWVSRWSWQYRYDASKNFTVFNHPDIAQRKMLLEPSLFSNQNNTCRVLRFLENNDLPRFVAGHTMGQTRMAAALLFALPGIPLLFCGQETGSRIHPYSKAPIFDNARSIPAQDTTGLFAYYAKLIRLRARYPALRSREMVKIDNDNPFAVSFRRGGPTPVIVILNLSENPATVHISDQHINKSKDGVLIDLLTRKRFRITARKGIRLAGNGIVWLLPKEEADADK